MALCLGDYAGGDWYFIAVCEACGRETALEPAEILARPGTEKVHRGMRVEDLEPLLRCRVRAQGSLPPRPAADHRSDVGGALPGRQPIGPDAVRAPLWSRCRSPGMPEPYTQGQLAEQGAAARLRYGL